LPVFAKRKSTATFASPFGRKAAEKAETGFLSRNKQNPQFDKNL